MLLVILIFMFLGVGGMIDYWQSAMEHGKRLPKFLKDYFLVIWLFVFTGFFPFLMILVASNYNWEMSLGALGAICMGTIIWDIVFSLLDKGVPVSNQIGYFVFRQKNYNLTSKQIYIWHAIRFCAGVILIVKYYVV